MIKNKTIMDYEKKYKEALERAKEYHSVDIDNTMDVKACGIMEYLFPELAGSKDERIRKWLIGYFHQYKEDGMEKYANGLKVESIIAWLEKQDPKKHEEELEKAYKTADKVQYCRGYEAATKEMEKQGEQKPQRMISAEAKEAMYNKPADTVEQKCEESKTKVFDAPTPFEDKLYAFVAACEFLAIPSKIEFILEHSQEILDAAREQIGKEQSSAWSEEDELVVEDIEEAVINYWHGQSQEDLLEWLKSLKLRYTWKPSDEQIGVVESLINNRPCKRKHVDSLYNDLKKLMEDKT